MNKGKFFAILVFFAMFFFFTSVPLHYVFFVFFIIMLVKEYLSNNIKHSRKAIFVLILYLLSAAFLTSSHILNIENSSLEHFTKFIIVSTLILLVYLSQFSAISINYIIRVSDIKILYFIIITLNFLQVFYSVYDLNIWGIPFQSEKSSISAYAIEESNIYFGSENKNIWASKVFLISLPLQIFMFNDLRNNGNNFGFIYKSLILFMLTFIFLYTQSRVAQITYLLSIFPLFSMFFFRIKNLPIKIFGILIALSMFVYLGVNFVDKFFYIQFDYGDGFFSRVLLWKLALTLIPNALLFGHGFESGALYIETIGLPAHNFHNVIINSLMDFGILGSLFFLVYISVVLKSVFFNVIGKSIYSWIFLFSVCCIYSVQYFGYDPELLFLLLPLVFVDEKN
jgi:hypothetical protein